MPKLDPLHEIGIFKDVLNYKGVPGDVQATPLEESGETVYQVRGTSPSPYTAEHKVQIRTAYYFLGRDTGGGLLLSSITFREDGFFFNLKAVDTED